MTGPAWKRTGMVCLYVVLLCGWAAAEEGPWLAEMSGRTKACVRCHREESRGLYQQWGESKHYRGNVGCYECHAAQEGDADAFKHYGNVLIATLVTPKDCAACHPNEAKQFGESRHSKAGRILGSLDNVLAEVVEGNRGMVTEGFPEGVSAAAVSGCWQCHGSEVKVLEGGKLDPTSFPNSGIGRINPDGSEGSCNACHQRHQFSAAQARHPDTCGKCHMGPDHPQLEIYNESKHGIAFRANIDDVHLEREKWIVGEDYSTGPTCATCHMSATERQPVTHSIGTRISWNNRPAVSIRANEADAKMGLGTAELTWQARRGNMVDVCMSCHNEAFAESFFVQYDGVVELYNEKFGKPGARLYGLAQKLLPRGTQFANKIDFTWFEIWHHEGRRARHGASMQGPDYTHWHGTYEVAKHWYAKYVPELEELIEAGKASKDAERRKAAEELEAELAKVLNSDDHKWYLGKMDPEEKARRDKAQEAFKARYEEKEESGGRE